MAECFHMARTHAYFVETMKRDQAAYKKRSRAAKRGWKHRKELTK
jgi:hypothetical protein